VAAQFKNGWTFPHSMRIGQDSVNQERLRILEEYRRRQIEFAPDFYSLAQPAVLFAYLQRVREMIRALTENGFYPLSDFRILEVGCGAGGWLADFIRWGAGATCVAGVDINPERLEVARRRLPAVSLSRADASELPWKSASFDLVLQSTMLSSILDNPMRKRAALEILRVLKPAGAVLWYDLRVNNPRNRNVRAAGAEEIRALFPDCNIRLRKVTLAPPVSRFIVPLSWTAAFLLEKVPVLRTHYLAVIRRNHASEKRTTTMDMMVTKDALQPLYHETDRVRICFLIRDLRGGGSARQLVELVKGLDKSKFEVTVITFHGGGALHLEVESVEGVDCIDLRKLNRWEFIGFCRRLIAAAQNVRPRVMVGYSPDANLLSLLLRLYLRSGKVIWTIANASPDVRLLSWLARFVYWAQGALSRFPDQYISNSRAGSEHYVGSGFDPTKMNVIYNGFDTERFRPNIDGAGVRAQWRVRQSETLIGIVGRLYPVKDHATFCRAASLLVQKREGIRFVCVGDGPAGYREEIEQLCQELGLEEVVVWAGERTDMPAVYNSFDLYSSSSDSEGLPNALGEAMACGVPCVATGVGDSAFLLGETGIIVPPRDPQALAAAWYTMLERIATDRASLGVAARRRIMLHFSREKLVTKTTALIEELLRT
jgi:glycosyltransferase involved in cell wall biosynthesis/SAM-dependent methyltransferase